MNEQELPCEGRVSIPVTFVGDTNCLASVMAMAINTFSWIAKHYPFTGHAVRMYLHKTWYTELFRGLKLLAEQQHIDDVTAEQRYILDNDLPLDVVMMQALREGYLVQLFVSGNEWLQQVRREPPCEREALHTVLVNGFEYKQGQLFFDVQDPDGGPIQARFHDMRPTLTQAYPDRTFFIEDIKDFKLYDRIVIWKRRNSVA